MKGWRARIGIMLPSVNSVLEAEFATLHLKGVTFHYSRMPLSKGDPLQRLHEMRKSIPSVLSSLETVADVVAFACTSGSFVVGYEQEGAFRIEMESMLKKTVITTTQTSMLALKKLEAKRVAVVTPYTPEINEKLKEYMEANGFKVTLSALDLRGFAGMGSYPEHLLYKAVRSFVVPQNIDALFIGCTNLATWSVLQQIENDIGKPVVTANQATLWGVLRESRCEDAIEGLGLLLTQH